MQFAKTTKITVIAFVIAAFRLGFPEVVQGQVCRPLGYGYSDPKPLYTDAASDAGTDERPQLATDGKGNWVAVWYSEDDLDPDGPGGPLGSIGGDDKDILFSRSLDDGATWSAPLPLNGTAFSDGFRDDWTPQIATDGLGRWVVVWHSSFDLDPDGPGGPLDSIGTDDDILFSISTDIETGATWLAPLPLTAEAFNDDGVSDQRPQIATDEQGNWVVVWQSKGSYGNDFDILFSRSLNAEATNWTNSRPLNDFATSDTQFQHDSAADLVTDSQGNWLVVWQSVAGIDPDGPGPLGSIGTDNDILFSYSANNGATWSPAFPVNQNAFVDSARHDREPRVATDGYGNWVTVWAMAGNLILPDETVETGDDFDILYSHGTTAGGWAWSDPDMLNTTAASDLSTEHDFAAEVAAVGERRWIAVWQSQAKPGVYGFDLDVAFSRGTDGVDPNTPMIWEPPDMLNTNAAVSQSSGDDSLPQLATDGLGNWVVAWQSKVNLDPDGAGPELPIGFDWDILFARLADCNQNGVLDDCEIEGGAAPGDPFACSLDNLPPGITECDPDCDGNNLPDACQIDQEDEGFCQGAPCSRDCQLNRVPDECDIAQADGGLCEDGPNCSSDCTPAGGSANGIPDECEIDEASPAPGGPFYCDPAGLEPCAEDCTPPGEGSGNGIPDVCELETDGDGVIDDCDNCANVPNGPSEAGIPGVGDQTDTDGDAVGDACDPCPLDNPDDPDGDGVCFTDDVCPGGDDTIHSDNDGVPDDCDPCPLDDFDDSDGDGFCDSDDICPGFDDNLNCDGDATPDGCAIAEADGGSCQGVDCSSDCVPRNGIPDECEIRVDSPAPGGPFYCDPAGVPPNLTKCDPDCDDNGVPDRCDIASCSGNLFCGDCNRNEALDGCDIRDGISPDDPPNDIPDECERPLPASYPHDRRKNRYISFDPVNAVNDGPVAFQVELKAITLGSCDGNGGFCRQTRGVGDCNECGFDSNPCINPAIDCAPSPLQDCEPTGQTCVNDAPDAGGSNVGHVWWVGPESPLMNGVHLLVSVAFRKVSTVWPAPTHVGDCEIVPIATYGIRKLDVATGNLSEELELETARFAGISSSWWADCVGRLRNMCDRDTGGRCSVAATICHGDADCPGGETCVYGTCSLNGIVCGIDADCSLVCSDHASIVCQVNEDCPDEATGETCDSQVCNLTNVCDTLDDCPAGTTVCDLAWTLPEGSVNFDDVNAALALVAPGATSVPPDVTWVDVHGNDSGTPGSHNFDPPNFVANFSDINQIILAFKGRPYTFYDPADCPDTGTWP